MSDAKSDYRIHGATGEREVVIDLDLCAQLVSKAKLFSDAATAFGAERNQRVSLVDAAMPGMLVGRALDEQSVLDAGLAIEQRAGFTHRPGAWG